MMTTIVLIDKKSQCQKHISTIVRYSLPRCVAHNFISDSGRINIFRKKIINPTVNHFNQTLAQVYQEIDVLSTKPKNFITTFV